jgi:hypothetical protein
MFRGPDPAIAQMNRMLKLTDETVLRTRGTVQSIVAAN